MVRFERTEDANLIRSIVTHPEIYKHVSDDGSPAPEDFEPPVNKAVLHVLVFDDEELRGLFTFVQQNFIELEVHTTLLPVARGPFAREASRGVIRWVWENTCYMRIITHVPAYNRLALAFAKRAGLIGFGVDQKSYLKNGKLWDQVLLGVSRPETT